MYCKINEDYYRAGTTTMSDLLDAQTMYQHSHDRYVEAYAQYKSRLWSISWLQGTDSRISHRLSL